MKTEAKNFQSTWLFARQVPWIGFGATLLLLVMIAIATDRVTTRLENDQGWVSHSQDVERILGRLRGDLLAAETARLLYVVTGTESRIEPYYSASQRIPSDIDQLKILTVDTPLQNKHIADLRIALQRREGTFAEIITLRNDSKEIAKQTSDLAMAASLTNEALNIVQQMRSDEDTVLKQRQLVSRHTYNLVRLILAAAFVAVVAMLALTFRRLWVELRNRMQAEGSVRKLNGRILQLQDTERRKVARELHDSIGQIFSALKINLSLLSKADSDPKKKKQVLSELQNLIEIGVTETRTLSHLLHPPLLDELGFSSAARWLVDGFSQRSKIQVNLEIPGDLQRMPQEVELVLFRVLQESLTNIHRHSGSATADIRLLSDGPNVKLSVRDQGTGISPAILESFRTTSVGLGVGLAGMRERVSELGGKLDLHSDVGGTGTVLHVSLPLLPTSPKETIWPASEDCSGEVAPN